VTSEWADASAGADSCAGEPTLRRTAVLANVCTQVNSTAATMLACDATAGACKNVAYASVDCSSAGVASDAMAVDGTCVEGATRTLHATPLDLFTFPVEAVYMQGNCEGPVATYEDTGLCTRAKANPLAPAVSVSNICRDPTTAHDGGYLRCLFNSTQCGTFDDPDAFNCAKADPITAPNGDVCYDYWRNGRGASTQVLCSPEEAKDDDDDDDEDAPVKPLAEREAEFMRQWGHVFTMVSLDEYLEEAANRTASAHGRKLLQANPFSMLETAIGSITGAWSGITSAFGSSYEEQLLETHMDNGWKKFKQATKVFKGTGLATGNLPMFLDNIVDMINLPSKYRSDFNQIAQWIALFDDQTWSQHDTQFSMGKGGDDSSFTMYSRNLVTKVDVLFLTCSQDFELADNYMVISESSSKLGGLFSSSKIKIKKMKAGLKTEDLKFISSYFTLLAYQQIAIAQGLQVPPDPQFP